MPHRPQALCVFGYGLRSVPLAGCVFTCKRAHDSLEFRDNFRLEHEIQDGVLTDSDGPHHTLGVTVKSQTPANSSPPLKRRHFEHAGPAYGLVQ